MSDNKKSENISESTQEKINIYQRILKIFITTFISSMITYFIVFAVCDALFNWKTITESIVAVFVFIFIFKFIYKKGIAYLNKIPNRKAKSFSDYSPGDTNDPRNPSSYATPGSPYYAYNSSDRDRFQDNRSAFSDSDSYYNQ